MGSDSAKIHEAFTVAPADDDGDELLDDTAEGLVDDLVDISTPEGKLAHTTALIAGLPDNTTPDHLYEDLAWLVSSAHAELEQAGYTGDLQQDWKAAIALSAADVLATLPDEKLQELAAQQGFEHQLLVSGSALTYWLNPAYPSDAPSKAKIQAKAGERYAQLAAGEVDDVHGHTLADVQAAEATLAAQPSAPATWEATPTDIALAMADVNQRLAGLDPYGDGDGGLVALIAAERRLHTASCPDMQEVDLAAAKAAATGLVDKQLASLNSVQRRAMVTAAVNAAAADGAMDEAQARWLDRDAQLALLRAATPEATRAHLEQVAADRAAQVAVLHRALAATDAAGGATPASPTDIAGWAAAWGDVRDARTAVAAWSTDVADRPALATLKATGGWVASQDAKTRTTGWRAWAKQQPLADLRAAAGGLGLEDSKAASRAQLQNYIAARWDPSLDAASIQQQVTAKSAGKTAKSAAPPAPAAATSAPSAVGKPTPIGATGGWRAKHAAAVAALKAHQALAADVPAPQPASEIAALKLSKGAPANAGGMHPKTLHNDQHGRSWLHKPDKTGGARAHAEAAAARLHDLAGIRTPPVYVRDVAGKTGSLQPWVAGGEQLPSDPRQWSQAEVDGVVRFHVAAWVCSNHDGNPSNILRTPSGGLAPIDHGQAWRYFGEDRLGMDYDPNGSYGNPPPAYLAAYKAAKAGMLAKGVRVRPEAALPAIKAFEQIPDAQLRAELEPVAAAGVQAGLPWVKRMRKVAAKRLGTTAVSDADVADEFCRQAIARKQSLRADFAAFFSSVGLDSGGLTKVA